jgi:hypothetical protein
MTDTTNKTDLPPLLYAGTYPDGKFGIIKSQECRYIYKAKAYVRADLIKDYAGSIVDLEDGKEYPMEFVDGGPSVRTTRAPVAADTAGLVEARTEFGWHDSNGVEYVFVPREKYEALATVSPVQQDTGLREATDPIICGVPLSQYEKRWTENPAQAIHDLTGYIRHRIATTPDTSVPQPGREAFDVNDMTVKPSPEAITSALEAFKAGRPVNCIQTAHLAKAAQLYLATQPEAQPTSPMPDLAGVRNALQAAAMQLEQLGEVPELIAPIEAALRELDALPNQSGAREWQPTHRHKKTEGEYRLVGPVMVQCATPINDEDRLYLYDNMLGIRFVRPIDEFNDGRFEALPAAPSPDREG